ncbi:hypothetical protein FXO37_21089 [Capsicum annuum]|nr:hypothetical protein FXO37_21089 [Capsicum annuum]
MKESETVKEYSDRLLGIVNKLKIAQEQRRLMTQDGMIEGALAANHKTLQGHPPFKYKLRWGSSEKGICTGKEGHSKPSSSNGMIDHWPWKLLWNTKLPTKVIRLSWSALRDAILTQDNLCGGTFTLVNRSYMCQNSLESSLMSTFFSDYRSLEDVPFSSWN